MSSNLKEIRKKISSVENTRKTTKAMKLVSTSKLRKAEEMARKSRLYAQKLNDVFDDLISRIESRGFDSINSRYFAKAHRDIKIADIIVITSDKGLCGGFNSATIKEAMRLKDELKSKNIKTRLHAIGKKAISFFNFNNIELLTKEENLSSTPTYNRSAEIMHRVVEDFLNSKTDEVVIIYNGFKNMLSQELHTKTLLPFDLNIKSCKGSDLNLAIEPDDAEEEALEQIAKKYFEFNIYYALLSSLAGEHSARMQAMDSASNNATSLIKTLTIEHNKARQEAITTELVEINAGAEAIK
ncbi:MAG: ATP synthase F1 subunit gamma [Helicobacter sp.]|nr:ATP synthase F1 subunit gamma [Helicobacter sp.]